MLAGFALRLQTGPDGFMGGIATSASVVLLGPVPGFHRLVLDAAGVFEQLGTRDGARGHKLFGRSGSPSTGPPVFKPRAAGLAARYRFGLP